MNYDLKSRKDEVLKELDGAVEAALEMIGQSVVKYASELAPKDTGRLKNSITHVTKQPDDMSVTVGTNVEYAAYQEFGTSKMEAHPYLKPAVENHMDEYKRMAEQALSSVQ